MRSAGDPATPSAAHAAALRTDVRVAYTNYTNVDARFARPDQPGDRLARGYSGTIDVRGGEPVEDIPERLFARHNRDDRPDGQLCPSLSVGDVVVVAEVAVSVHACGCLTDARQVPLEALGQGSDPWGEISAHLEIYQAKGSKETVTRITDPPTSTSITPPTSSRHRSCTDT